MKLHRDPERAALAAGTQLVGALTMLAGGVVALTAMSAGCGYFFFTGYLSTIGAPWLKDVLPASIFIAVGAPFVMTFSLVALMALLYYALDKPLPRLRYVIGGWIALVSAGGVAIAFSDSVEVPFVMQIGTGLAFAVVLPVWAIRMARAWHGRKIAVVPMLINVVAAGSLIPLFFGISKGLIERAKPQILSKVMLLENLESKREWRLVYALDAGLLVTEVENGVAFREFRILDNSQIERIHSSRASAPWAPTRD